MASTKKKWSEQETIKFVELYEVKEVLWNLRLKDYKNKDARNAAIQRLIHNLIMGCTIQDVNNKINNIRSTYMQEKAKIKKSTGTGSGADDVYVLSLVWFEIADRFLSGVIKSRKTFQNVENSNECSSDSCPSSDIADIPSPDITATYSPEIPAIYSPDIPVISSPDIPTDPSPAITSPSTLDRSQFVVPSYRKRITKALPQHITKTIETLESIKDQTLSSREREDEFFHFGRNIASQLRQMPILDALDVQSDILNLIKNKRQSLLRTEQARCSSNDSEYIIEIPEHIIFQSQQSIQNVVQNQEENTTDTETNIQDSEGFLIFQSQQSIQNVVQNQEETTTDTEKNTQDREGFLIFQSQQSIQNVVQNQEETTTDTETNTQDRGFLLEQAIK